MAQDTKKNVDRQDEKSDRGGQQRDKQTERHGGHSRTIQRRRACHPARSRC